MGGVVGTPHASHQPPGLQAQTEHLVPKIPKLRHVKLRQHVLPPAQLSPGATQFGTSHLDPKPVMVLQLRSGQHVADEVQSLSLPSQPAHAYEQTHRRPQQR